MMKPILAGVHVSRETIDRLEVHRDLLKKWNSKINLVSPGTIENSWERHVCDSAQLVSHIDGEVERWTDLGSGGGFPGLIVAAIVKEKYPETRVTLVESDQRKCAFLRVAGDAMDLDVQVIPKRIENLPPSDSQILSARALAPLEKLLSFASLHLNHKGIALLPKGQNWQKEVVEAQRRWRFKYKNHTSVTDPKAAILEIRDINHV